MRKLVAICLTVVFVLAVVNTVSALTMLDPGYVAQTYVTYTDSVQGIPRHMTFDNNGNLYIAQYNEQSVWRVTPQKVASQFATGLSDAYSLAWTGGTAYGDYLYVGRSDYISKVNSAGTVSSFVTTHNGVASLAVDNTGNYGDYLYAGTGSQDHTYRITTSGSMTQFSNFPGWINGGTPDGLAFYNGNKYAKSMYMGTAYGASNASVSGLFTLDTNGNATRFNNSLVQVWEIGFAGNTYFDGQLMVIGRTDYSSPVSIWSIDPSGIAREIASSSTLNVLGLTFGNDGAMYVSEYSQSNGLITVSRVVPEPATFLLFSIVGGMVLRRKGGK